MIVLRGIGLVRGARRIVLLALGYLGALAVLWALGLEVYGWRGWLLVLTPLAGWIGARVWSWHRVSVEVTDEALRYEGAAPRHDFEVALDHISAAEPHRDGVRLRVGGEERLLELSPRAARALARHLEVVSRRRSSGS